MMKGAGANILRGVAGAGVLAGFDKFKEVYIAMRTKAQQQWDVECKTWRMRIMKGLSYDTRVLGLKSIANYSYIVIEMKTNQ